MSKSADISELKKALFAKKNALKTLNKESAASAFSFAEDYKIFLNQCKTERETVRYALKFAEKAGFKAFSKNSKYEPGDKLYFVNRNKAMILAIIGKDGLKNGAKFTIAHIDSPRIDLKPNPIYEKNELAMFKTHYYGGLKKYHWLAIPLALHGVISKKGGEILEFNIGENIDEPCFYISDLLPHLGKNQMSKKLSEAFPGENLNALIGSLPFQTEENSTELVKLEILRILNEKYGIVEKDFVSAELSLVPNFKAQDVGFDRSLIGGYGHDDRSCAYAALQAILSRHDVPESTIITCLCDKEETGSDGNTGMNSSFFRYFVADLAEAEGLKVRDVLSRSTCISSDVDAAFDPNFASEFENLNSGYLNHGVALNKYTGHGGKYDTSDASSEFMRKILDILDSNEVLWQACELGKVDAGGGGTIAKYIANLDVDTIDMGVPVMSMHSPYEVISKIDLYMAFKAYLAFFEN